jgi:hypothetical protein
MAISTAIALLACGCGGDENPTAPSRSGVEHLVIVRVLNAQSGTPLTNISVTALDGPQAGTTVTSPSDQVPLQLRSGQVTLRITAHGFYPIDHVLRVTAPIVVEVRSDLIAYSVSGMVRDVSSGARISDAEIAIVQGTNSGDKIRTQNDGSYRFDPLRPGAMRIRASASNYVSQTVDLSLAENQVLDFALAPDVRSFGGSVRDGRRAPVPGVMVRAVAVPSGLTQTVVTGANGAWEFRMATDRVTITVVPPAGYEGDRQGFTMTPDTDRVITTRRILSIVAEIGNPSVFNGTIGLGTRLSAYVGVRYDDSIRGSPAQITETRFVSSNPSVLRWNYSPPIPSPDGGGIAGSSGVEGIALGSANVTATYWGFTSPPVSIQVIP